MDRVRQRPVRPAGAGLALGQIPLTLFSNPRSGLRQFLLGAAAVGSPDTPSIGRASLALLSIITFSLTGSTLAQAQDAPVVIALDPAEVVAEGSQALRESETRIGGAPPLDGPCVVVDIAGDRAGHLECATQKLTEAARVAQEQTRAGIDAPVISADSPDVQTGVAHQSATRLRMGSGFGNSVHPERPVSRPPRAPRP